MTQTHGANMKELVILICFLIFTQTVTAGKFYKWTDADGNSHYSDKKPLDRNTSEIKVSSRQPTINNIHNETQEPAIEKEGTVKKRIAEHYKKKKEVKAKTKKNKKKCIAAKTNLAKFEQAANFRMQDPQTGKYVYLQDNERTQIIEESNKTIKELCK